MLNTLFQGIFQPVEQSAPDIAAFILCLLFALALGCIFALCYRFKNQTSFSFLGAIALLPMVVCVVILMVNGNIGTGVAVAGAFTLVRFRSLPGNASEIGAIFAAMGIGLICGMGYLGFAALFAVIIFLFFLIYHTLCEKQATRDEQNKLLRVTIPEDLDYTGIFDDLFAQYTKSHKLVSVKTTNLGSMFRLVYEITLRDAASEKPLIDAMRCRNGNLEICVSMQEHDPLTL